MYVEEVDLNEDNMDLMRKAAKGAMQTIKFKDGKLKVDSFVVDAPTFVGRYEKPVIGVAYQVRKRPSSRKQVNVGHSYQGNTVPTVGAHCPIALSL